MAASFRRLWRLGNHLAPHIPADAEQHRFIYGIAFSDPFPNVCVGDAGRDNASFVVARFARAPGHFAGSAGRVVVVYIRIVLCYLASFV